MKIRVFNGTKVRPRNDGGNRRKFGASLLRWADAQNVALEDGLRKEIQGGFPHGDRRRGIHSRCLCLPLRLEIHAAQEALKARVGAQGLFQLCVFRLGFLQDGDVGVGVFPEREEILIRGAGFGGVSLHGVSTRQSQPGQRTPGKVDH